VELVPYDATGVAVKLCCLRNACQNGITLKLGSSALAGEPLLPAFERPSNIKEIRARQRFYPV